MMTVVTVLLLQLLLLGEFIMCEMQKPQIIAEQKPTIEVTGTAIRQQAPKAGVITVPIEAKAPSQEAAWGKFQDAINQLRQKVGDFGTVGNSLPTEKSEEVSRGLRSVVEYTVTDSIEVEFILPNYGHILDALLNCGLPISAPRFTYEEQTEVTPELLTQAAAAAKVNAEAIAAGVHSRLGRLVAINVGHPSRKRVYRPQHEVEWNFGLINRSMSLVDSLNLTEDKLETFNTEIQITVEFEILELQSDLEAA
jgi:uncharacterized protein YggE